MQISARQLNALFCMIRLLQLSWRLLLTIRRYMDALRMHDTEDLSLNIYRQSLCFYAR